MKIANKFAFLYFILCFKIFLHACMNIEYDKRKEKENNFSQIYSSNYF